MSKSKSAAVSLIQGVNIPVETQESQAEDAANEAAEQHEKAIDAAIETATKFVESTAQFHMWLDLNPSINNEAYSRAQTAAIKQATQDVEGEAAQLRAKLAELEGKKVKMAAAFSLPSATSTVVKAKRGHKAKGTASTGGNLPNESDILAAVADLKEASISQLAVKLNVAASDQKSFGLILKKLRADKRLGDKGAKRGLRYILP